MPAGLTLTAGLLAAALLTASVPALANDPTPASTPAAEPVVTSVLLEGPLPSTGLPGLARPGTLAPAQVAAAVATLSGLTPAVTAPVAVFTGNGEDRPDAAGIAKALGNLLARPNTSGSRIGVRVVDFETGKVVYAQNDATTYMPASNTKTITAVVASTVLGADTRYRLTRSGSRATLTRDDAGKPISEHVEFMMRVSDNALSQELADVSVRVADADSFQELARQVLASRGIDVTGLKLFDGSGLSRNNRISPTHITDVLYSVAQGGVADPAWPMVTGLPVSGWEGTLYNRFVQEALPGRGLVRAKTGTLTGVISLGGVVTTRSGDILLFSFMADRVPPTWSGRWGTRALFDRAATKLAMCGCRS